MPANPEENYPNPAVSRDQARSPPTRDRGIGRGGDSARPRAEGHEKRGEPSAQTASLFAVATTPGAPRPMGAAHGGGSR